MHQELPVLWCSANMMRYNTGSRMFMCCRPCLSWLAGMALPSRDSPFFMAWKRARFSSTERLAVGVIPVRARSRCPAGARISSHRLFRLRRPIPLRMRDNGAFVKEVEHVAGKEKVIAPVQSPASGCLPECCPHIPGLPCWGWCPSKTQMAARTRKFLGDAEKLRQIDLACPI